MRKKTRWLSLALCAALVAGLLCGCGGEETTQVQEEPPIQEEPGAMEPERLGAAETLLAQLTTEEKVGQLFFVQPEALEAVAAEGSQTAANGTVTTASSQALAALADYPVGGIIFFGGNVETPSQLADLMVSLSRHAEVPLVFSVDEEGGTVARIGNNGSFGVETFPDMADIGATGDPAQAQAVGQSIGTYLRELGFQLDFAPVADVNTNPNNPVIGDRAFHSDPEQAAMMVSAAVDGFHQGGVACTLKHFPGHGDTAQDSHYGYASSDKTWEEMRTCELYPFQAGIAAGADAVMVSHITTPNATSDGLPASLSYEMITEKLRGELRFQRLVVTDSLAMEAITDSYSAAEASLMAFQAGADVLLMPADLGEAYDALLAAVQDGTISQERLDESVLRILQLKENYGLIS